MKKFNTKMIVTLGLLAAIEIVFSRFLSINAWNIKIGFSFVPLAVAGMLYGALPAGITAVIADLIGGWGMWFDWSIGNAVMGFCVGLLPIYGARIKEGVFTVKQAILYAVCCILGNMVAFGVITPVFSYLLYASDLNVTFLQAFAATLGNSAVLVIIGIPVLLVLAKRYKARTNLTEDQSDQY